MILTYGKFSSYLGSWGNRVTFLATLLKFIYRLYTVAEYIGEFMSKVAQVGIVIAALDFLQIFEASRNDVFISYWDEGFRLAIDCFYINFFHYFSSCLDFLFFTNSYLDKEFACFSHLIINVRKCFINVKASFFCFLSPFLTITISLISNRLC